MKVLGLDACRGGWVVVTLAGGRVVDVTTTADLAGSLAVQPDISAAGIDIPIGLPADRPRAADRLARAFVGPRWRSVFITPPLAALEAATHAEGNRICRSRTGSGMSQQAYRLREKVLEVDVLIERFPVLHEVHPEVSFCAMAARHLRYPKKSWNGFVERLSILERAGLAPPFEYCAAGDAAADDVLDALAAAWSARRIARGEASTLPEDHDAAFGRTQIIWY